MVQDRQQQLPLAKISIFGISFLHRSHPLMVAWWSAVFPGFGHYLLNQYFRATLLTLVEVTINTLAHINEAMIYSFCGKFKQATDVLEPRWAFGYLLIYMVVIWDSYRSSLSQNKLYLLLETRNAHIPHLSLFSTEFQYLEKKRPLVGAIYSFFFPGLGQLYNHRFGLAFYAILWWWIYLTLSGLHESLLILLLEGVPASTKVLRPHWLMFMPSVMGGSIYEAYVTAIEHNRLFRMSQRQRLTERYGDHPLRLFAK